MVILYFIFLLISFVLLEFLLIFSFQFHIIYIYIHFRVYLNIRPPVLFFPTYFLAIYVCIFLYIPQISFCTKDRISFNMKLVKNKKSRKQNKYTTKTKKKICNNNNNNNESFMFLGYFCQYCIIIILFCFILLVLFWFIVFVFITYLLTRSDLRIYPVLLMLLFYFHTKYIHNYCSSFCALISRIMYVHCLFCLNRITKKKKDFFFLSMLL